MELCSDLDFLGFGKDKYQTLINDVVKAYGFVEFEDFHDMEALESVKARLGMKGSGNYLHLVLILSGMLKSHALYREKGISDEIYYDTMSDALIWAELYERLYGEIGLRETQWLLLHINLKLFRLGRLQFEKSSTPDELKRITDHDTVIQVHVPEGGSLRYDDVLSSFEKAREFYGRNSIFICDSWLLEPELEKVLPRESNIIKFQRLFDIFMVDKANRQCHQRVFEYSGRKSRLQERILDEEKNGTVFGVGYGMILP